MAPRTTIPGSGCSQSLSSVRMSIAQLNNTYVVVTCYTAAIVGNLDGTAGALHDPNFSAQSSTQPRCVIAAGGLW